MSSPIEHPRSRSGPSEAPSQGPAGLTPIRLSSSRAWREACDEATLLSPHAAAFGRPEGLSRKSLSPGLEDDTRALGADESAAGWEAFKHEVPKVLRLALPLSVTNLSGFALGLITVAFVGRLGEFELSVAILATSIFNVTGLSVLTGFAAAMETFCGQAYGAGSYLLVGVVLQRAVILTTLLVAAVAALWTQAERLLHLLGQDPAIAGGAARYLLLAIPALLFTGMFEASKRYLMAQGEVRPATAATLLSLALSPLYNWLLIFRLGWGLDGAVLAVDAVQITMASGLGAYIALRDWRRRGQPTSTWGGWSADALRGWGGYFRFALPSVAMICAEWWTFEVVIIMSGWLARPDLSVAVMGLTINLSGVVYMLVTGLAMATSVRVSNSLGAGFPRTARRATLCALLLTMALEIAAAAAVVLGRQSIPRLFTNLPAVVDATSALLPIFALSLPGDGINAVLQGLLRGAGKQELGAVTNICSYWFFGIPLAAFFAFKFGWGVTGLWWGLVAVNCVQGTVMLIIALRFDFAKQAERAQQMFRQHEPLAQPLLLDSDVAYGSSDMPQLPETGAVAVRIAGGSPEQLENRGASGAARGAAYPQGPEQPTDAEHH